MKPITYRDPDIPELVPVYKDFDVLLEKYEDRVPTTRFDPRDWPISQEIISASPKHPICKSPAECWEIMKPALEHFLERTSGLIAFRCLPIFETHDHQWRGYCWVVAQGEKAETKQSVAEE